VIEKSSAEEKGGGREMEREGVRKMGEAKGKSRALI